MQITGHLVNEQGSPKKIRPLERKSDMCAMSQAIGLASK